MFSARSRGEPSSLQEAFSPSYPEPPCCRRVRRRRHAGEQQALLRRASLSPAIRKQERSCTQSAQPSDKGSVPCTEGVMQDKGNSSGKAENSPSCWCEVLWHLIYEVFVPPGLSWEMEAAALIVKSFCTEQCCLLLSRSWKPRHRGIVLQLQEHPLLLPVCNCLGCIEETLKVTCTVKRTVFSLDGCQAHVRWNCREEWTELEVGFTVTYPPSYAFYWRSVQQVVLKLCFLTNPLCLREWQYMELITDHLLTASDAKILCSSLLSQEAANGHSRGSVLFLVGKRNWESIFRGCRQPRACGKWTLLLFGLKSGA